MVYSFSANHTPPLQSIVNGDQVEQSDFYFALIIALKLVEAAEGRQGEKIGDRQALRDLKWQISNLRCGI
ncbi:MAG: hypothetical protein A2W10_12320 [Deltaproteobacteria bacterium RBG_16_55_12]|nr:MAG: hypothetical protein A2W10_12320 [Deltaproteobacteria bacterium RBG_16_55_12]